MNEKLNLSFKISSALLPCFLGGSLSKKGLAGGNGVMGTITWFATDRKKIRCLQPKSNGLNYESQSNRSVYGIGLTLSWQRAVCFSGMFM